MMQKNEDQCLEPWLRYHGHLFGYSNLFVIDHNSDDLKVLSILKAFSERGVHVMTLGVGADYRQKGAFVSYGMKQVQHGYDFVLPLDCDEFVAMRDRLGRPTCSPEDVLDYFSNLDSENFVFSVNENLLNMLGHPRTFFALPYKKVFFRGGSCQDVDHGSHDALSNQTDAKNTRIVYVHFHHKSFARYRSSAREKLKPFVDVDDPKALATFSGTGWHLVAHLQKSEEEFYAIMTPDSRCIEFPELYTKFQSLGIDPLFCERV